jgi:hypothetical protein
MKTACIFAFAIAAAVTGCTTSHCDPNAPNTICTIAGHTLNEAYSGNGGPAIDADMYIPIDSAVAPDGTVWFIDFNNYVIRRIDDKGIITTVVGNSQLGDSPADQGLTECPALDAANNHTTQLDFYNGTVYLAAWHESRVKSVTLSTMEMQNVAGRATRSYYDGDGGPALMAALDLPSGVTIDPSGNLVVMDQGNLVVRKIDSATGTISTIAGMCIIEAVPCSDTVQPVACPNSDKYVCNTGSDPTSACTETGEAPSGTADMSAALCTQTTSGDGGLATAAQLNIPFTQFADPGPRPRYDLNGDLIIPESGGARIRKVDHTTGIITTIAGTGTAGYAGDGGPATQAEINHPVDLAIAPDNTIYFSDVWNHCIRKIDPSGTISTVVGKCHFTPSGDPGSFSGDGGSPLEAELYKPYGIDLVGNKLYVSDSYNNRLRVVNLPE